MQPNSNNVATTPVANDVFMQTLQDKLIASSELISSEDTNIEKKISSAISSVKKGQEASTQRITSAFDREKSFAQTDVGNQINTEFESGRGFGVNIGVLREITQTGDKRIDDLEQRKQELILAGEAEAAGKIAGLQLQELQFQQEARQRTFQNLLSLGSFGMQARGQQLQERAQSFQEKSALGNIALQYGVSLKPGDTIDTVVSRAMQFASQKQQLELSKLQAEINKANAETAKALKNDDFILDDVTAPAIASFIDRGLRGNDPTLKATAETMLANLIEKKGAGGAQKVGVAILKLREAEFAPERLREDISSALKSGQTKNQLVNTINLQVENGIMTPDQAETARKIVTELAPPTKSGTITSLFQKLTSGGLMEADRKLKEAQRQAEEARKRLQTSR